MILLLLPLIASLGARTWYNDIFWQGRPYGVLGILCIVQPTLGAALLVWGTVWRIKFGDGKPDDEDGSDGDEPTYVRAEGSRGSRLVGAKSISADDDE